MRTSWHSLSPLDLRTRPRHDAVADLGKPAERAGNHRSGSLRLLTPQDVQLDAPDQAGDVIPRHGFFDFVVGNDEQELARPHVVP